PAGGAGIAAAVFVAAFLLAGGVGGVVDTSIPDTVRVGDEPIVDPIGPLDAAPLGFTEPLPHKEAAAVTAVTASWVPPPPPPPRRSGGAGGGGGGGGGGSAVLTHTNAARAANGLGGLSWNGTLASRSCSWATHLATVNGELAHSSNGGGFSWWGENVAYGPDSASSVVSLWMNSTKGHRENILRPQYTMMGSCSATSATGRIYWVQQFGA
ncbi:MAG: CAP domain-containing protein, partial [Actinomycetota bacterium]|nr:CAP domain-containing protein [Actinomycetota bacterium]